MKLIYLNLIISLLYVGCSGVRLKVPLPAKATVEPPAAELFPRKLFYISPDYNKKLKGVLAGHSDTFIKAAQKYKLPVKVLISISCWESNFGRSKAAVQRFNISGQMVKTRNGYKLKTFPSVSASIDAMAANLSKNYFRRGLTTLPQIKSKYAPGGGVNKGWVKGVKSIMSSIN